MIRTSSAHLFTGLLNVTSDPKSFPVFSRRHMYGLLEYFIEILQRVIPHCSGYFVNFQVRLQQQFLRLLDPDAVQIIDERITRILLDLHTEIRDAHAESLADLGQRMIAPVVLPDIVAGPLHVQLHAAIGR